jgi:hypothetical protein
MISTRNLDALPDIPTLSRLTRSLAVLDAILSSGGSPGTSRSTHTGVTGS